MKAFFQNIANFLQKDFEKFLIFYIVFCGVSTLGVLMALKMFLWIYVFALFSGFLVLLEMSIRIIMRMAYGPHYLYSIQNYFLVDHPEYGNCFRKGDSAKKLEFLLFDREIYPFGSSRVLDLKESKRLRKDYNINSLGFRGKSFSPYKKSGKLRIFCSGGSTTAGVHNNDDECWPAQLEMQLEEKGFGVEVINAGVHGWYSYQEYLRFKNEIQRYHADILLIHQGWNEEFNYSSLSLGKHWRPEVARSVKEVNYLYCPPQSFLSNTKWLGIYLTAQAFLKNHVFIPNMRFANPKRWLMLKESSYILAWFDNLIKIARIAQERNILVYTINYPGLVDLNDSSINRAAYIENSRLTPLFADYQAVGKKRISYVLKTIEPLIGCLNTEDDFLEFQGDERNGLFYDEIHTSPKGDHLLAKAIGKRLVEDGFFKRKYSANNSQEVLSNVRLDKNMIQVMKEQLEKNPLFLNRFIDKQINSLSGLGQQKDDHYLEIPEERYTTF